MIITYFGMRRDQALWLLALAHNATLNTVLILFVIIIAKTAY